MSVGARNKLNAIVPIAAYNKKIKFSKTHFQTKKNVYTCAM